MQSCLACSSISFSIPAGNPEPNKVTWQNSQEEVRPISRSYCEIFPLDFWKRNSNNLTITYHSAFMLRQLRTDQKLIANLVKSLKFTKTKSHHVSPQKPRHSVGISTVSGKGFSRWSDHWHGRGRFALTIRTRRNGTWS